MTLKEKLQKIQLELKVNKGQRNNFGKYNYRSAEDILEAIKPLQKEYKVQFQITEDLYDVCGMPYVKSMAIVTDLDSEESIDSVATALVDLDAKGMQMPQRTGSASSYAKKYALGNLLLIDDTKDSDAVNTHDKSSKPILKIGTTEYVKCEKALASGKFTIADLEKKYSISEVIKKQLNK